MSDRVIVFLDYQNVYHGARSIFHNNWDRHTAGQIDPLALGLHLAADSPFDRQLHQVRVYRGRPAATRDPKGYASCTRQCMAWERHPQVTSILRTLLYPPGWPATGSPREKGIDVALALDFAIMAVHREYDVGILMSTNTDLKPALEIVARSTAGGGPRAEVAAWSGAAAHDRRLSIAGRQLWCHWLDQTAYTKVRDETDYSSSR